MVNLGYGRDRILEEIDQCEVICVNCHRLHHWERNDTAYGGCTSHHKDDRRRDLREWITQVKRDSEGCGNCAEERPILLDFHHPGEKEGTIARMVSTGQSVESIRSEIDRCELLCANCHRRLHHDDAF